MKRVGYLLLLVIFMIPFSVRAIVPQSDHLYITDQAELLTNETADYIINVSHFLYQKKKIQYVVLTTDSLEGMEADEYCDLVFKEYELGKKGLLILIDSSDAIIRVQIGSELAQLFDEDDITNFINTYFAPYIQRNEWDKGIKNGYNAFLKVICDAYDLDASEVFVEDDVDFTTKYLEVFVGLLMVATIFISKLEVDFYNKIFRAKKTSDSTMDSIIFAILIALNALILGVAYYLRNYICGLMFIAQIIIIYSLLNRDIKEAPELNNSSYKKRLKKVHKTKNNRVKKGR